MTSNDLNEIPTSELLRQALAYAHNEPVLESDEYVMYWRDRLACFGARSRGTCTDRLTISRQEVEERVLVTFATS